MSGGLQLSCRVRVGFLRKRKPESLRPTCTRPSRRSSTLELRAITTWPELEKNVWKPWGFVPTGEAVMGEMVREAKDLPCPGHHQ